MTSEDVVDGDELGGYTHAYYHIAGKDHTHGEATRVPSRPRCPVCFSLTCPQCHRADEVHATAGVDGWWYACARCWLGFRDPSPT